MRAIIVGAGPGGATLAFLLARRGIDTVLIERQRDFAREFRGEVLLPSGLEPFEQMALQQALDAVPHVALNALALFVNGRQRLRASFDAATFGARRPRWVSQPGLLEMLVSQCRQFPNFQLLRGAHVRDLIFSGERVVGVEIDGGSQLRADVVIGADGRTSIVRRRLGVAVHQDSLPMDVVWCRLPMPGFFAADPHLRVYLGRGHLLLAAPVYDGRMQIAWVIAKGAFGEIRHRGMPECLDEMAAHVCPDLAAHLVRHRSGSVQPFLLSTVSDRVTPWSQGGVLLIGDAAHTMSPVGAQGLNIAIRDAIVTANHLVPALAGNESPARVDEAARRVERERLSEVEQIQRLQAFPPRVLLRDTWTNRLLLSVMPALLASSVMRSTRNSLLRRLGSGVGKVRLSV